MPRKEHPRDIAIANLRAAAPNFDIAETKLLFKNYCVVLEYFQRPNHCGGIANPSRTEPECRMLSSGKTFKWNDVPLKRVLTHAESWIEENVEKARRTEAWNKLHEGLSPKIRTPKWDIVPDYPNEYPATPYSACRAESAPSNAELIDKLAKATGQDMEEAGAIITWLDAYCDKSKWRKDQLDGRRTAPQRLGREHTLEDVPHHFVRDQLMRWIQTHLPKRDRRAVEVVVFDDLNDTDLDAYAENLPAVSIQQHEEPIDVKSENKRLHHDRQKRIKAELDAAVEAIDCGCDLTQYDPPLGLRIYPDWPYNVTDYRSAIVPNRRKTKEEERILDDFDEDEINYDCDQIRAMIARLVKYGDWTIEEFRSYMRDVTRAKLTDFLKRRGPKEGRKLNAYLFAWEFFRKREFMNIPLPEMPSSPGSRKRKGDALTEQSVNVAANTSKPKDVKEPALVQPEPKRASKRMK